MLGDPLFLHFDYMQFAQFTDGLWTCWMRIRKPHYHTALDSSS